MLAFPRTPSSCSRTHGTRIAVSRRNGSTGRLYFGFVLFSTFYPNLWGRASEVAAEKSVANEKYGIHQSAVVVKNDFLGGFLTMKQSPQFPVPDAVLILHPDAGYPRTATKHSFHKMIVVTRGVY
jgi:hypothetical protein